MTRPVALVLVLLLLALGALLFFLLVDPASSRPGDIDLVRGNDAAPSTRPALRSAAPDPTPAAETQDPDAAASPSPRDDGAFVLAIAGEVVGVDGRPAAGVTVVAWRPGTRFDQAVEGSGTFRFGGLADGPWDLAVVASHAGVLARVKQVAAGTEDLVIRLPAPVPPRRLVHVLDSDGRPVPRFHYVASHAGAGGLPAQGRSPLAFGVERGAFYLAILRAETEDGEALAPATFGPFPARPGESTVRLGRGLSIKGRILDPDGEPVAGAGVFAMPIEPGPVFQTPLFDANGHSDAKGAFRLSGLAPGRYRLHASVAGPSAHPAPVTAQAGSTNVALRLVPGTTVGLLVLDAAGRPVESARIAIGRGLSYTNAVTDEEGRADAARLEAGVGYLLRIDPPAARPDLRSLYRPGWRIEERVLRLKAAGTVSGRVVDAEGEAVSGIYVRVRDTEGAERGAHTNADGAFLIGDLSPGPLHLRVVHAKGVASAEVVGAEGGEVELALGPAASLEVAFENLPVTYEAAWATIVSTGRDAGVQSTLAIPPAGTVRFEGLDPTSDHAVYAILDDGQTRSVAWAEAPLGADRPLRLRFEEGGAIRGRIDIAPDAPRPRVEIEELGPTTATTADANGAFLLQGVPEGTWTVRATSTAFGPPHHARAKARPGETVHLTLPD